jgi:hypothetical protein
MELQTFRYLIRTLAPELAFGCYALGVYPAVCAIAKRSGFREVKNTEKPTQTLQELWDHIEKIYLPKRKSC